MWQDIDPEKKEVQLITAYQAKLATYLRYTGSCPVRERSSGRVKYFIVFASRHKDTLILLNDIAVNAYFAGMHKADLGEGLLGETDWREMRFIDDLDNIVLDMVAKYQGETRQSIWFHIISDHFMRYLESEYLASVKHLIQKGKLFTPDLNKTGRLNDDCRLYPPQNQLIQRELW